MWYFCLKNSKNKGDLYMKKIVLLSQKGYGDSSLFSTVLGLFLMILPLCWLIFYGLEKDPLSATLSDLKRFQIEALSWLKGFLKISLLGSLLVLCYSIMQIFFRRQRKKVQKFFNQKEEEKRKLQEHFEDQKEDLESTISQLQNKVHDLQRDLKEKEEELGKIKRDEKEVLEDSLGDFLNDH